MNKKVVSRKKSIDNICILIIGILCIPLFVNAQESRNTVQKSIYDQDVTQRSGFYNFLWGKHYRKLYTEPVSVESYTLDSLLTWLKPITYAPSFYGVVLDDRQGRNYLIKPLGGTSSFLKSQFFREMYNREDFKDTYLDGFIGDAYTIVNPYTFTASDYMARESGLSSNNARIYYIESSNKTDSILDSIDIKNKLASIVEIPDTEIQKYIISTDTLLEKIRGDKSYIVNQDLYIRERLFDMIIGDWNKTPENWYWLSREKNGITQYDPIVVDRSHAFMKIDGLLTKQMLSVISLGFISDYKARIGNVKNFNKLAFTLDVALTAQSNRYDWFKQARILQETLTDNVINTAFARLPKEIQGEETEEIKEKLKKRRDHIDHTAVKYFDALQFNPVITGTEQNDKFIVDRFDKDSIRIDIYKGNSDSLVFTHKYTKKHSREIWLYGMDGNDSFEVRGSHYNRIPLYLLAGKGENEYNLKPGSRIKLFGYSDQKDQLKKHNARVVITDNDKIHTYDYEKTRYSNISFSPWGVYDTDWGLSLGSFVTYTQYGLKRSPFSYQHRIGYNYLKGFMYKGIFPMYDERKSIYLDAFIGSPSNFSNFFGFGNNTNGFKDQEKDYNRARIGQYSIAPSFHYIFDKKHQLIFTSSFELFKLRSEENKYINDYYGNDPSIFDAKYFVDLSVSYQVEKPLSSFIPVFTGTLTAGWKLNLTDRSRNYPYTDAQLSFNFAITDRITLATKMKGRVLYNNKYEFYQSASTELRGYRDSRFIGRQSYYQYSDLRIDMGKIKNPFTPLKYGLFGGFDFGRVWYPEEPSKKWHASYGGGAWVTIINKITTKYSWFGSGDDFRFMFELGMGF